MSEIKIRHATREDCQEIDRLIRELAEFEKRPEGPKLTIQTLQEDGFDHCPPRFLCIVAEESPGRLCGYAIYFPTYSTWEGKAMRLEDIYVSPSHRRTGLGRRLLCHVIKESYDEGFCRIDFSVLSWNPATGFYTRLGADNISSTENWSMWRFDREGMKKLMEHEQCN